MDVIAIKPFDRWLHGPDTFVMGQERQGAHGGLCNAILMAAPNATFGRRWLQAYTHFSDAGWKTFSVSLPRDLWLQFPEDIKVLGFDRFFYPLPTQEDIALVYERDEWDWENQFAYHSWVIILHFGGFLLRIDWGLFLV